MCLYFEVPGVLIDAYKVGVTHQGNISGNESMNVNNIKEQYLTQV